MKNSKKVTKKSNKKKNDLFFKIVSVLLIISFVVSVGFIIYFELLPIQYLSMLIIFGGLIVFGLFKILNNKRLKKAIKVIFSIPSILLNLILIMVCLYSVGTLSFFNKIFDTGIRTDGYSLYVLKDSEYEKVNDLSDKTIGVIEDENKDKVIDKLSNKIEFDMVEYKDVNEALDDLENNEIDSVVALDSNIDLLQEDTDEYDNIKKIYSFNITNYIKTIKSNKNVAKDNFVFYISGVDTNGKVESKARSDVNILVAVNPSKNKILMVNTPRDYYVKLHSKKSMDKLTHAGVYGIEESVGTLEDLYDIKVDYYARVNFTTFVNIVEKLGGITVDVPVSFCEQTSSRTSSNKICLRKGVQELNGEQALALSRTRHTIAGGDRGRIENQMLVLKAIIDKAMSPSIIVKYNSLLGSVSDSVITNIDQKSVTKLVKKQIKSNDAWEIKTYSVDGSDASNTTYSTGSARVYVMNPKEETVMEAKKKLDDILETNKYKETTTALTTTKK